jgi:hypothetical protein
MLNAPPQPVSASTSSGRELASVIRRMSVAERIRRDSAAGDVDRLEAGSFRHAGRECRDGADDLKRLFSLQRGAKFGASGELLHGLPVVQTSKILALRV